MNSRRRRIALACGYAAFLLVFVEIALQIFYYLTAGSFLFARSGLPLWAPNQYSTIFNKPNLCFEHSTSEYHVTIYTNSKGFRVSAQREEYRIDPTPSTFRIMLLGPSFAFGWGVNHEDTFAVELEGLLRQRDFAAGRDVEIINAGVNSLSPAPHLNWYRHVGSRYQPDLVIQFIYGSMVVNNAPKMNYTVSDEGYLLPLDASFSRIAQAQLKKFATVFYLWVAKAKLTSGPGSKDAPSEVIGAGRVLEIHEGFDPYAPKVRETLNFYDDLERTVRQRGAELLVVYFPLSYVVHEEDYGRWATLGVRNVDRSVEFDDDFCRFIQQERKIPCLNITGELLEASQRDEDRLYYWLDVHWTPRGNLVAARAVSEHLLGRAAGATASDRSSKRE